MKLYNIVKDTLILHPITRSSDKRLIWYVMMLANNVRTDNMTFVQFMNCPSFESITRARRKVQENHPDLQAGAGVKKAREDKESTKGTFVYKEEV